MVDGITLAMAIEEAMRVHGAIRRLKPFPFDDAPPTGVTPETYSMIRELSGSPIEIELPWTGAV